MVGPYNLKRFNLRKIKPNAIVALIGKRRSGKSVLMRDIAWHLRKELPFGVAMSPTEEANQFFGDFMPQSHIHYDFEKDAIEQILIRQQAISEAVKAGQTTGLPKNRNAFIFADDCMYDKSNWRTKLIRNLFMNGRHWNMFLCFTMQYAMDILPELRENIDYVFIFRNQNKKQKERFYEQFFGMFDDKHEFIKVFDEVAVDNDCIVLDNTSKSNDPEECVYWCRAALRPEPFRLGSKLMWKFDEELNAKAGAAVAKGKQSANSGKAPAAGGASTGDAVGHAGGAGGASGIAGRPKMTSGHVVKLGDEPAPRQAATQMHAANPVIAPMLTQPAAPPVQPSYPAPPNARSAAPPTMRQRPPSPFRRGKRPAEGRSVRFNPNVETVGSSGVPQTQSGRPPSPFSAAKRRRRG